MRIYKEIILFFLLGVAFGGPLFSMEKMDKKKVRKEEKIDYNLDNTIGKGQCEDTVCLLFNFFYDHKTFWKFLFVSKDNNKLIVWYFKNRRKRPLKVPFTCEYGKRFYENFGGFNKFVNGVSFLLDFYILGYQIAGKKIKKTSWVNFFNIKGIKDRLRSLILNNSQKVKFVISELEGCKNLEVLRLPQACFKNTLVSGEELRMLPSSLKELTIYCFNGESYDDSRKTDGLEHLSNLKKLNLMYGKLNLNGLPPCTENLNLFALVGAETRGNFSKLKKLKSLTLNEYVIQVCHCRSKEFWASVNEKLECFGICGGDFAYLYKYLKHLKNLKILRIGKLYGESGENAVQFVYDNFEKLEELSFKSRSSCETSKTKEIIEKLKEERGVKISSWKCH